MPFMKHTQSITIIKMENTQKTITLFLLLIGISILLPLSLAAPSTTTYCCEKTTDGAFCIDAPISQCNETEPLQRTQSACRSTDYCELGTCYNNNNGECGGNVAKSYCLKITGGEFINKPMASTSQCQQGCCVLLENAQLASQTRCKALGTIWGINSQYNAAITSESECISSIQTKDMGACVTSTDTGRQCTLKTRGDCAGTEGAVTGGIYSTESGTTFYSGYLCSDGALSTVCGKQASTKCGGQDDEDVYWYDTCGNKENVYSGQLNAKGVDEVSYHDGLLATPEELKVSINIGSTSTGNCDYYGGTTCAENDADAPSAKSPKVDYYCKSTTCMDGTTKKRNGESWCIQDTTNKNPITTFGEDNKPIGGIATSSYGLDPVGSEYARKMCVNGQIIIEGCEPMRKEVCMQGKSNVGDADDETEKQITAKCVENRWESCIGIDEEEDCENRNRRDCIWLGTEEIGLLITTNSSLASGIGLKDQGGVCVPMFAPGLDESHGSDTCASASISCGVKYRREFWDRGFFETIGSFLGIESEGANITTLEADSFDIEDNADCLNAAWGVAANEICVRQGDCGAYKNYNQILKEDIVLNGMGYSIDGNIEPNITISGIQDQLNQWVLSK